MKRKLGIYIHIPFCVRKCRYCGFYSKSCVDDGEHRKYVKTLIDDIESKGSELSGKYSVDTIFIGGGTPSVMDGPLTGEIVRALRRSFDVEDDAEITIETNPKTLDEEKLMEYREAGINRLSIGCQSLDDEVLGTLGRIHSADDFRETFALARRMGFDNINIDLMFAVPGHTMEKWDETLTEAIALRPEHISFYSLQIEEGTPFYDMFKKGEIEQVPDEIDRQMYHHAIARFREAGYEHYEISNCALPGRQCRHNLKYWSMEEYLGLGDGASSFIGGVRYANHPLREYHKNNFRDDTTEFVWTGLRKTVGVSFDEFRKRFGLEFWMVFEDCREELQEFFDSGRLIEENGRLRLSEEGMDVSNQIMSVFV